MEDQYGIADLRQYVSARPSFFPPPPDLISGHRGLGQPHPYDQLLVFRSDSAASVPPPSQISGCFESGGGAGRWPRQETLTLLEIRSRLDPKFKEANQKGPLWDDVSRSSDRCLIPAPSNHRMKICDRRSESVHFLSNPTEVVYSGAHPNLCA